jgi:arylsulfatase A-like enzyme
MSTPPKTQAEISAPPRETGRATVTVASVLHWAIVAGVATGLIEAGVLAFRRHIQGRMIYQGMHFFWLSPLTNLLVFLAVGLLVVMVVRQLPWLFRPRVIAWIFLLLAMLGLRSIAPRVHAVAWLMLSAGVATVLAELLSVKTDQGRGTLRRFAVGGLVLCCVLTLTGLLYEPWAERQAIAQLPAAAKNAPNVLWIVLDTVPAKRMSLYGYSQPTTPQLDQFAQSGVVFQRCMSTSPWTLPGHGSMFTGFMPRAQTSDWTVALDSTHPTIAQALQQHGYATAGFGANTYYLSAEFGLGRGFGRFREPRKWLMQAIKSSQLAESLAKRTILPIWRGRIVGQKNAAELNRECLGWLDQRPLDRPYCVFLNYIDTHGPYVPPADFDSKFGSPRPRNRFPNTALLKLPDGQEQLQQLTKAYEACLAYVDDQVGRLLAELKTRGLLDNTLVIIVGDHGEQLGENGIMGHANSLYLPQIHVPLILSYPPRLPAGRRVEAVVSYIDLPATVTELLALPVSTPFPRSSLVKLIDSAAPTEHVAPAVAEVFPKDRDRMEPGDELAPISRGEMRCAVSDQYHYIRNGDGTEELYRYLDDPEQTTNVIAEVDAAVLQPLRDAVN